MQLTLDTFKIRMTQPPIKAGTATRRRDRASKSLCHRCFHDFDFDYFYEKKYCSGFWILKITLKIRIQISDSDICCCCCFYLTSLGKITKIKAPIQISNLLLECIHVKLSYKHTNVNVKYSLITKKYTIDMIWKW